jgi:hypothetical protein
LGLPHDIVNNAVIVHPSTMRYSGLSIGKQCVLENQYIGVAWPSTSVVPTTVSFPEELVGLLEKKSGEKATISHCTWMNNHSIVNNIMWQAQFFSCNNKISFINFLIYLSSQTSHYL